MTVLLLFLFLLSRLLHLLFYFPEPFVEELLRGTIAKELIEGLRIPFFDYTADHYHGGSLVYGALTVPFFLLFGKTVFVLRLTGVLFQLGAFITWYLLMKRFVSPKAALYTALLYLLPPPYLTREATYAMGVHAESLFFTALGLFFLFRILYEKRHPLFEGSLLGLVMGFGTYFSYQCGVTLLSFLLFWIYADRELFKKKEFYLFILFFLVGFSPWFVYNSLYTFHGVDRVREAFSYPGWERFLIIPFRFLKLATHKLIGMFSFNFRGGIGFHPYFPGHPVHPHVTLLNLFYYGTLLYSYSLLFRFEKKNKKTHLFFLFPVLLLLVASATRLDISTYGTRYFLPLFPFFFAVIAMGLISLEKNPRLQRLSLGVLTLLLAMGVAGELNLLSPKEFLLSIKHQGFSYRQLGGALGARHPASYERLSHLTKQLEKGFSDRERCLFYLGLSESVTYSLEKEGDIRKDLPWLRTVDKRNQPFLLEQAGYTWGLKEGTFSEKIKTAMRHLGRDEQPHLLQGLLIGSFEVSRINPGHLYREVLREAGELPSENRRALVFALGKIPLFHRTVYNNFLDKVVLSPLIEENAHQELFVYYQGVGAFITNLYDSQEGKWSLFLRQGLERIEEEWKGAIFWGAGFEAPLLFEDPYEWKRMKGGIPPEWRETFEQGIYDRFAWGGKNRWIEE